MPTGTHPDFDRLASSIRSFRERRILVVGDLVADQFLYGEISRVSREAPVLILRHERTETVPGGAANCVMNLATLGASASIVGVVGDDEPARSLLGRLNDAGVDCSGVVIEPGLKTTTKVRVLAGHAHSSRQQVIRVDYDGGPTENKALHAKLAENVRDRAASSDALIVSDYDYGVAGSELIDVLRKTQDRGTPVLIDSRFRLLEFRGFTTATPNEDEIEQILDARFANTETLADAGERLRTQIELKAILITRGRNGMLLIEDGKPPLSLRAIGERDAVDGTGAGDTVIATYALALASGCGFADAAVLANHAGGVVVMKRGTATLTTDEILGSMRENGV